jgi:cell division protein FtsI (penicillin-binding protein 3)
MRPYLVKEIINPDGTIRKIKPEVLKSSIVKGETIRQVKECLEEVVISGTGKKLKSDKYDFAGKTGTSRVNYFKPDERPEYNASFVGYFPADNPKYSIMVMLYDPKKSFYGSSAAGPVFRSITDRIYAIKPALQKSINEKEIQDVKHLPRVAMGNGKDFDKVFDYVGIDYKKEIKANWVVAKAKMKEVPDVRNMGLRDALYVLENLGLNVKIYGSGKVGKQSLVPGSTITGQEIEIYLN